MLTRVITALVLLPLTLAAVFYLPADSFALLLGIAMLIGAWEWGAFMQVATAARLAFVLVNAAGFAVLWQVHQQIDILYAVLMVALLWWLAALVWITRYPRGLPEEATRRLLKGVTGLLTLQPAFVALGHLQSMDDNGPLRLLSLLVIIWAADTGAYFFGRSLGKHKLAPNVSPGKTWEGALGGQLCAALMSLVGGWYVFELAGAAMAGFVVLGMLVAAVSVVGDLSESMLKRHAGVKDSGTIFPGHGGMMDRIDSLTAAAPCYLLGLLLLQI